MVIQDHLSMLLTKIRNGQKYNAFSVSHPYTNFLLEIVKVMYHQGYLRGYYIHSGKIFVLLKYINNQPVIKTIKRVSKPSKKIYWTVEDLKNSTHEGTLILSTTRGVLSDRASIGSTVGGEVLVHLI